MTEDEMVGWHHRLNGHAFQQAPGVGGGQGGLACCSPVLQSMSRKELDLRDLTDWHTTVTHQENIHCPPGLSRIWLDGLS